MTLVNRIKIEPKKILFFLSGIVIFTDRIWGQNIYYYAKHAVAGVWCFFLVIILIKNKGFRSRNIKRQFVLMVAPLLFMALYAIFIWFFQAGITFNNYSRVFSTIFYLCLAWGFASIGFYYFGKKCIDYLFYSAIVSYFLFSLLCLIVQYGFNGIVFYIQSLLLGQDNSANYIMEVHDLTFAMGVLFIYYAFFEDRKTKNHYTKIILSAITILLGLKRAEILAIAIAVLIYYLLLKWGKKITFRAIVLTIVFTVVSLGFVYVVDTGLLNQIVSVYDINTKGRIEYYGFAKQYFHFGPDFFGMGFTRFTKIFEDFFKSGFAINGHGVAASIHSNTLLLYIENGFVVFVLWIIYCFGIKTKILSKKCGILSAESYLLLTVYVFILYLTDNTFKYFDTQMMYFLIPLAIIDSPHTILIKSKINKKREENNEKSISM